MKLFRRIYLTAGMFTTILIVLTGFLVFQQWFSTLRGQLELAAVDQAVTISKMESIRYNLTRSNGSIPIQRKVEELRLSTRSQYIYVLNRDGIYYAHTSLSRLDRPEKDSYLLQLLEADSPKVGIRHAGSASIPAVEAAAPVFYQGEMVGLVVVGLLNGRIYQEVSVNIRTFILFLIIALFVSLYSSGFLARSIMKSTSGLEPDEISRLLGQRAMTLENLKEGIVTTDQDGRILYFNNAASDLAGFNAADIGRPPALDSLRKGFRGCMSSRKGSQQEILSRDGTSLQCRFEPILDSATKEVLGATVLLEDLSTVRIRAEELTGIRQINEGLRAQNHEFLNKLHTISGLIQLEEYSEAVRYISGISRDRQEMTGQLSDRIKEPSVAGLLLGKYNKAQEQKTGFRLNRASFLSESGEFRDTLLLVLGNLIENSLEELADNPEGIVAVKILETSDELLIEVRDNGKGLPDEGNVFNKGFSRKGEGRGYGLYLVSQRVRSEGGRISVDSRTGHCSITVKIPRGYRRSAG